MPEGAFGAELQVEAELLLAFRATRTALRCIGYRRCCKGQTYGGRCSETRGVAGYQKWKAGVLEFARVLPMNSQGEPAPSDKDPIPAPFDNTYNQPERDHFHTKAKYYRTDQFLVEHVLDDATRLKPGPGMGRPARVVRVLRRISAFTADKFKLEPEDKSIAELTDCGNRRASG